MGRARADDFPPDGGAALQAGLALPAVDPEIRLEPPELPVDPGKGIDRGAHVGDGRGQYFLDDIVQSGQLADGNIGDQLPGVDPGPEQGLIGIDIADTRQQPLIQQGRLDHAAAPPQARDKIFPFYFKRLRSQIGQSFLVHHRLAGKQADPAEPARVLIPQLPHFALQTEQHQVMGADRRGRASQIKMAGHLQMDPEGQVAG